MIDFNIHNVEKITVLRKKWERETMPKPYFTYDITIVQASPHGPIEHTVTFFTTDQGVEFGAVEKLEELEEKEANDEIK